MIEKVCSCCNEVTPTQTDPHIGEVCIVCRHLLEHAGLMLANNPALMLCHPPAWANWRHADK